MIEPGKAADPGRFVYLDPFLIEQRRINLGLSRTQVIKNMAVAPNTIKGVFRGTAILANTAFRLAKQLRCEVSDLLSKEDERYVAPARVAGPMAGASEWEMDVTYKGAPRMKMCQVAVQKWQDGKIINERFYYSMPN